MMEQLDIAAEDLDERAESLRGDRPSSTGAETSGLTVRRGQ